MSFLAAKAKRETGWLPKFSQSGQRKQVDLSGAEGEAFFGMKFENKHIYYWTPWCMYVESQKGI